MRIKKIKSNNYILIVAGSVLLFTLSTILVLNHEVTGLEKFIMEKIYGWSINLEFIFWAITQLGSVWVAASGILIFWLGKKRRLATDLFLGGGLAYAAAQIAKVLVARPRPGFLLPDIIPRFATESGNGFPSGHTAMITVFCITITPYLPKRFRWLPWLAVLAVAVSRIYLGVHAPLDVVGGFAIGAATAYSIRYWQQKNKKS